MPIVSVPKQENEKSAQALINTFNENISTWEKRVQSLRQEKERENPSDLKEILDELDQLSAFLKGRLTKRLQGIRQYPEDLQLKYLRCIEPFYTEAGITRFMGHYFDVEVFKQVRLRYRKKKDFEKEVNILFDLYRVKKTIETISTLENSVKSNESFPSRFGKNEQAEFLKTLREIFKLFFIRFVKKEYRKQLFETLSESHLDTDQIIDMRKKGTSYVTPEAIQSNEYRDKFITVFFSTLLRTKTSEHVKDLHFNFLNFEVLKNEFLTHWMQQKLKNNPEKDKVLQNYQIGGKSVAQLIKESPDKEADILSSIPLEIFNDMAEEINQKVRDDAKTPVTTFSRNHGLFSRLQTSFEAVKQVARYSVDKMEEMKPKTKIWTVKKKPAAAAKAPLPEKVQTSKPAPEAAAKKEEPRQQLKIQYGLEVLTLADIDNPFFDQRIETYPAKLDFLAKKMGDRYEMFTAKIWQLFNLLSKDHFIIRRDPCHEWAVPFLFNQGNSRILLMIGAEISKKHKQVGYKSKFMKEQYDFNTYFHLATQTRNAKLGKVVDIRKVRNVPFHLYAHAEKTVLNMSFNLLTRLFQTQDKTVFKSANLAFRIPDDPFEELEELKRLIGKEKKKKDAEAEDAKTAESASSGKSDNNSADKQAERPGDIREVARQLKMEMEEKKNKPIEPELKSSSGKVFDVNAVASQVREEMAQEKARKEQTAAQQESSKSPQKVKDIRQVAKDLKEEINVD